MKSNFLILALFLVTLGLQAQEYDVNYTGGTIAAEEVPAAVLATQAQLFPNAEVRVWRKRAASSQHGSRTVYISAFNANQVNTRVQIKEDGTGISVYSSYAKSALPQGIQDLLANSYADYKLTGAAEITELKTNKSGFRIRLRKGASKLVLWLDENGQEISANQIPPTAE